MSCEIQHHSHNRRQRHGTAPLREALSLVRALALELSCRVSNLQPEDSASGTLTEKKYHFSLESNAHLKQFGFPQTYTIDPKMSLIAICKCLQNVN